MSWSSIIYPCGPYITHTVPQVAQNFLSNHQVSALLYAFLALLKEFSERPRLWDPPIWMALMGINLISIVCHLFSYNWLCKETNQLSPAKLLTRVCLWLRPLCTNNNTITGKLNSKNPNKLVLPFSPFQALLFFLSAHRGEENGKKVVQKILLYMCWALIMLSSKRRCGTIVLLLLLSKTKISPILICCRPFVVARLQKRWKHHFYMCKHWMVWITYVKFFQFDTDPIGIDHWIESLRIMDM